MIQKKQKRSNTIVCPSCLSAVVWANVYPDKPLTYCPFCANLLHPSHTQGDEPSTATHHPSTSLIRAQRPPDSPAQFQIGPYKIFDAIGKGGMGEVLLAYDPVCGRRIALKRMREDLKEVKALYNRFLKEARITSQLTHPSIIPIYSIHVEGEELWYTMPYVKGKSLYELLKETKRKETEGKLYPEGSIATLIRPFIDVAQAIFYAHSHGVLHRDIKPENILLGEYGEVMIIDWGLAELHEKMQEEAPYLVSDQNIRVTQAGKVVGTLSYMAPERAIGYPASVQTDIYALGVILYQILTLKKPFKRKSIQEFRKRFQKEEYIEPTEAAPNRDVPARLAEITKKCLHQDLTQRYPTVEELLQDLAQFIEGRSEWYASTTLSVDNKEDWEFQENILLAESAAVSHYREESDWVHLMISKRSFPNHLKVEGKVRIKRLGLGFGILLDVPESGVPGRLKEGFFLFISSDKKTPTTLYRSSVEVMRSKETLLKKNLWYTFCLEKIEQKIHFYLNDELQFTYLSHSPLTGTHLGILFKDAQTELSPLTLSEAGQNVMVSCLSVPDTLFAMKEYDKAISEYRRIGYSLPGRTEGREAILRAGFALIEKGEQCEKTMERLELFDQAYYEFEKLHKTPYAPLEYLGKALVYEAEGEYEDEVNTFELALRRYPNHPLRHVIQEEVSFRMHRSSSKQRLATFLFAALMLRHIPHIAEERHALRLFQKIARHQEAHYFFIPSEEQGHFDLIDFLIPVLFNIQKSYILEEVITENASYVPFPERTLSNALFALVEMEEQDKALQLFSHLQDFFSPSYQLPLECLLSPSTPLFLKMMEEKEQDTQQLQRILLFSLHKALRNKEFSSIDFFLSLLEPLATTNQELIERLDVIKMWRALWQQDHEMAYALVRKNETQLQRIEGSPFHFLFGAFLAATEGQLVAQKHFQTVLETPYPRSWMLASHYLTGHFDMKHWLNNAFFWEKRELYRQLSLYHFCLGNDKESRGWEEKSFSVSRSG